MKVRIGFVSNSSSSSFVIPKKEYSSVFDLAKKMIPSRDWQDSDNELIRKIEESEIRGMDKNTSICFQSCNYETYIVLYKDYYLVSTCNNHSWDIDGTLGFFPKDLKEIVSSEGESYPFEELEGVVSKLSTFWYPEYDVGGTPLDYDDPDYRKFNCREHSSGSIRIKGMPDPVCLECYSIKLKEENSKKDNKKFSELTLKERISFVQDKFLSIENSLSKRDKLRVFKTLEEVKRFL